MFSRFILFIMMSLMVLACGPNISSSELKSTEAEDLKIDAMVTETNGHDQAEVSAILETLPDEVGIQFNQGETISAMSEQESGELNPNTNLSYDNNIIDLGEQYIGSIPKAPLGKNYIITYKDKNGKETKATFYSKGVSELITPTPNQKISLNDTFKMTWNKNNQGKLKVRVFQDTANGGWTESTYDTPDNGEYLLDFKNIVAGPGKISLIRFTKYDQMPGFLKADVRVQSIYEVNVVFIE